MGRAFRLVCGGDEAASAQALLRAQGFGFSPEPFSPWAMGLSDEPLALGSSLAARFGLLYIQDRSSMLPPLALDPPPGARVLDLCAAPGGKSSFLAQLAGPSGFVLANEPDREREAVLRRNLFQMNLLHAATCSHAGERMPLPDGGWDHILLDPPCSGWGTAEKNPRVLALWRDGAVEPLISLQRRLLAEAARLLAPGGTMLYSTCTTNEAENEAQAVWACRTLGLELEPLAPFAGFSYAEPALPEARGCLKVETQPGEAQGFFLARLRKPGSGGESPVGAGGRTPGEAVDLEMLAQAGLDLDRLPPGVVRRFGDAAWFVPRGALETLPEGFVWRGFPLGRLGRGGFRPHARLRALLPAWTPGRGLDAAAPETLEALLSGRSLEAGDLAEPAGLYFRGLGLGWLRIKGRRALWSDR